MKIFRAKEDRIYLWDLTQWIAKFPDLYKEVIGGMPGEKLNWYRAPSWSKTVIATPAIGVDWTLRV